MGGFFSIDGPFYRIGNIVADIMILSFVWLFFSIPLFTIGASTTALFYVVTRRISNKEGYLMRDFWTSFKGNFKQATLSWLVIVLLFIIILINLLNINAIGSMKSIIFPFQICFMIELSLLTIYIFPIIARFDMSFKETFKTAFFMANKHIFTSILCLVASAAVLLASYIYPLFAVVAMGTYAFAVSYLIIKVFKRYRPEMDADDLIGESISKLSLNDSTPVFDNGPAFVVTEIPVRPDESEQSTHQNVEEDSANSNENNLV